MAGGPVDRGTISVPEAGRRLGISRGLAYALAATDQFPVRVIRAGRRLLVPTAEVDRALGLRTEQAALRDAADLAIGGFPRARTGPAV